MDTDTVHEPKLPGVRTYKDDIIESESQQKVGGVSFTVPQRPLEKMLAEEKGARRTERTDGKQLFDVERAFNNEVVQEGTIVTDKRRSKNSIGGLLKSALTEWWGQTQESLEKVSEKMEFLKPQEVPTVVAPEERVNTILEAAQHARQAPRDDHKVVIEKIRTFAHDAEVMTGKPFTVKAETSSDTPTWIKEAEAKKAARAEAQEEARVVPESSHTLDLRSSSIAPDVTKHSAVSLSSYAEKDGPKKVPLTREALTVRVPEKPKSPIPEKKNTSWSFFEGAGQTKSDTKTSGRGSAITPVPRPVPEMTPNETTLEAGSIPREVIREERILKTAPPALREVSLSPVQFEYGPNESGATIRPKFEAAPLHSNTISNKPSTENRAFKSALIAGVIILGSALGIFAAVFFKSPFPSNENVVSTSISIPTLINTDTQVVIPLGTEKSSFFNSLMQLGGTNVNGVVQYYPVTGEENSVATTNTIMSVLSFRAPGSFIRALNPSMMWGFSASTADSEPFIVLQSQNYDVMFAGMLEWEPFMSEDLAPLFGTHVKESRLPSAQGKTSTARFSDALQSNRSIRILYDETGEERIVYAFVNKSLILITTNTEALSRLIERIR
jgi:hypothetical protein